MQLTHTDDSGQARMVNVQNKEDSFRRAVAVGQVKTSPQTIGLIKENSFKKGDVLNVARIAGIMAAKQCPNLIPLCHSISLTGLELEFQLDEDQGLVMIQAEASSVGKTGVEMEALTAVAIAALTIYDMCKAVDKQMSIENIHLSKKEGGKSGSFVFGEEKLWQE